MSLLDNLPDKCLIRRRIRERGSEGFGTNDGHYIEQTNVSCWLQQAGSSEIADFEKRNIKVSHKIFFADNPNVTENHEILVTERSGVASNILLTVVAEPDPDASAGLGVVWRVMSDYRTGEYQ